MNKDEANLGENPAGFLVSKDEANLGEDPAGFLVSIDSLRELADEAAKQLDGVWDEWSGGPSSRCPSPVALRLSLFILGSLFTRIGEKGLAAGVRRMLYYEGYRQARGEVFSV